MNVRVSGKKVEIGTALSEKVRAELATAIAKHFDGGADTSAVFSHEGPGYRADCSVHLDTGAVLKAEGLGKDAHAAFQSVLEHLEKQLRRYKRRLKNHRQKGNTLRSGFA